MQTRLEDFLLVLAFDSEYEKVFTCWERMYIHRQRARLFAELEPDTPPRLSAKIKEVQRRIKAMHWKPTLNKI